ncbi:MAG: hypothetical protein QMD20_05595 [Candidatus Bathyarchaeia archaeon]|nr:hypothetical protein [Candidatus Bathyarchaeia archaeon]
MSEEKLKKIDKNKLPFFYRLILKIPGANYIESVSSGIFWALIVPIFLVLEFFLNLFLLLLFPFPINIALASITPVAILIIFVRISLERFINWWNLNVGESSFEWNIKETMQEYLAMLKEKEQNE